MHMYTFFIVHIYEIIQQQGNNAVIIFVHDNINCLLFDEN